MKRFSGNLFPAARTSRNLTMTKVIDYCNGSNNEGFEFYYNNGPRGNANAGQRLQVYITCKVELEYEFKEYTDRQDRAIYGDGEIIIDWKYSSILEVEGLTVDLINSDGDVIFNYCEHNFGNGNESSVKVKQMMNYPLDDGTKLGDAIWEQIQDQGPDQDKSQDWVEAIDHNEEEAKEEAMAAAYPEEI